MARIQPRSASRRRLDDLDHVQVSSGLAAKFAPIWLLF
jgi:hypothetical protein